MDPLTIAAAVRRAPRPLRANTLVAFGDSIALNGGTWPNQTGLSWQGLGAALSGGRYRVVNHIGEGGKTAAYLRDNYLTTLKAISPKPGFVAVMAGRNDAKDASAVVTPIATSIAAFKTIFQTIYQNGRGSIPVVCTVPPATDTDAHAGIAKINQWLASYASAQGFPLADFYAALVRPDTGTYRATYTSDGTHPTTDAAVVMARVLAEALEPWLPPYSPPLAASHVDPSVALTNPLCITASGGNAGIPDQWTESTGTNGAYALVANDADIPGKWWQIRKTSGVDTNTLLGPTITVTAGDKIAFGFRAYVPTKPTGTIDVILTRTSNGTKLIAPLVTSQQALPSTCVFYAEEVVPASWVSIRPSINLNGVGELWVSQLTLRNLTSLGVDS